MDRSTKVIYNLYYFNKKPVPRVHLYRGWAWLLVLGLYDTVEIRTKNGRDYSL